VRCDQNLQESGKEKNNLLLTFWFTILHEFARKKEEEEIFCHNNPAFSDEKIIKYP
jgi:hypothetical protein